MFVFKMSALLLAVAAGTIVAAGWFGEQVADLLSRGVSGG